MIVPDLRGAGRSDAPEGPDTYAVDGWASDVMAILNQLGVERPVLVGAGSGGDVALAMSRLFPDLPGGLVLAGPWPDTALPEEIQAQAEQQRWLEAGGDTEYFADLVVRALGAEVPGWPEVAKLIRFCVADAPTAGLIGGLAALRQREAIQGDLVQLELPVLLVRGERDPLTTTSGLAALRDAIPRAGLVELDRCGHLVNLEAPDAFNRTLDRFLEEIQAGP